MRRYPMETIVALEKKSIAEQAEIAAYRIDGKNSNLYIPGEALRKTIINGALYSKGKGPATLKKPVTACLAISPEYVDLGTKKYEIDSRPVVIKSTRARVPRHRPHLRKWQVTFSAEWDDILLTEDQFRKCVNDAGLWVGVLDNRVACGGTFGKFDVISWDTE